MVVHISINIFLLLSEKLITIFLLEGLKDSNSFFLILPPKSNSQHWKKLTSFYFFSEAIY